MQHWSGLQPPRRPVLCSTRAHRIAIGLHLLSRTFAPSHSVANFIRLAHLIAAPHYRMISHPQRVREVSCNRQAQLASARMRRRREASAKNSCHLTSAAAFIGRRLSLSFELTDRRLSIGPCLSAPLNLLGSSVNCPWLASRSSAMAGGDLRSKSVRAVPVLVCSDRAHLVPSFIFATNSWVGSKLQTAAKSSRS